MNIGSPIQDTRGEPEFVEAPGVPLWLRLELLGNKAFVQEAIENADTAKLADAWLIGEVHTEIANAVMAWIDTAWRQNDYDAACISRMWRENAEEQKP